MRICPTLAMLALFVVGAPPARAQKQVAPATVVDTIDIVSAKPGVETRLLLIGTGALVTVISPSYPVAADTLSVMTPVRLVLPLERFSLAVTTTPLDAGAETIVRRLADTRSEKAHYESTFSSPFKFVRDSVGAALKVDASRGSFTRVP